MMDCNSLRISLKCLQNLKKFLLIRETSTPGEALSRRNKASAISGIEKGKFDFVIHSQSMSTNNCLVGSKKFKSQNKPTTCNHQISSADHRWLTIKILGIFLNVGYPRDPKGEGLLWVGKEYKSLKRMLKNFLNNS